MADSTAHRCSPPGGGFVFWPPRTLWRCECGRRWKVVKWPYPMWARKRLPTRAQPIASLRVAPDEAIITERGVEAEVWHDEASDTGGSAS